MAVSGGAHGRGAGPEPTPPVLRPGLRWRRVFPGEGRQLGALRRWLASLLPDCPARDDVLTVATEYGANAVRHTASGRGGWFAVEVTCYDAVVRVAVADGGAPSGPRTIVDPMGESGRGLVIVGALAVRTGVCGDYRGRLVWADISSADDRDAASPRSSAQDPYEAAIRDGQAELARRFGGVPAWFGRATLQWWALAGRDGLVTAPSAQELASLLSRMPDAAPQQRPGGWGTARTVARTCSPRAPPRVREPFARRAGRYASADW